ncbi:MAG: bacterioferritin [Nitrospinae bacterium]|nr:bacterioferritin [Nitrospinota bacterium]
MKGDNQVIGGLNEVLLADLTATNMYHIHCRMEDRWGYKKLAKHARDGFADELRHADKVIERILFLEGVPDMAKYGAIQVGNSCEEHLKNEYASETEHVKLLRKIISICIDKKDFATKEILDKILEETEEQCDWLEAQFQRIKDVGIENYLSEHMHE